MSKQVLKSILEAQGFQISNIELTHYQLSSQERIFALIELQNIEQTDDFYEKYHNKEIKDGQGMIINIHQLPVTQKSIEAPDKPLSEGLRQLLPKGEVKQYNSLILIGISPLLSAKELLSTINQKLLSVKANKVILYKREDFLNENFGIIQFKTLKETIEAKNKLNQLEPVLRRYLGKEFQGGALLADPYMTYFHRNSYIWSNCNCLRIQEVPLGLGQEPLFKRIVDQVIFYLKYVIQQLQNQSFEKDSSRISLLQALRKSTGKDNKQLSLKDFNVTSVRIYQNGDAYVFFNRPLPEEFFRILEKESNYKLQITSRQSILSNHEEQVVKECFVEPAKKQKVNEKEYNQQQYNISANRLSEENQQSLLNFIFKRDQFSYQIQRAKTILEKKQRQQQQQQQKQQQEKNQRYDDNRKRNKRTERESYERDISSPREQDQYQKRPKYQQVQQVQQPSQQQQQLNLNQQTLLNNPILSQLTQPIVPAAVQAQLQMLQQPSILSQQIPQQLLNDPSQIQNLQMTIQNLLNVIQQQQMYPQQLNYPQQQPNNRY